MDILEILKKLVPGLTEDQIKKLAEILGPSNYETPTDEPKLDATGDPLMDPATNEPMMKSLFDTSRLVIDLKSLGYDVVLPGQSKSAVRPPYNFKDSGPAPKTSDAGLKSLDAQHILRFSDEDAATKSILGDVIGTDYRQRMFNQNVSFGKYLREGDRGLDREDVKNLKGMIFPIEEILHLVKQGMSIEQIKATQVEAAGELGGFAVPPNSQTAITARMVGRTAVRSSGARVVQLTNSNSIEIPIYRGSDNNYIGLLRGAWGNETKAPGAQNVKLDMETIVAHVYTYKVSMSQSLVEDAANLVSIVEGDIADTMTMDEDFVFLAGDGVGKPRGILPGNLNADSLKEVKTSSASALTTGGIKSLKRGVPSQYRDDSCVWVANSDTFGLVENLTVGGGNLAYAFPDLSEDEALLGRKIYESGAMVDVAANVFPMLFGNMKGYTIVERLGMTIQRFQDSNTGPNIVEYHVRRRLGGRVEKPWMFAVLKVAA